MGGKPAPALILLILAFFLWGRFSLSIAQRLAATVQLVVGGVAVAIISQYGQGSPYRSEAAVAGLRDEMECPTTKGLAGVVSDTLQSLRESLPDEGTQFSFLSRIHTEVFQLNFLIFSAARHANFGSRSQSWGGGLFRGFGSGQGG